MTMTVAEVKTAAREIADSIIESARTSGDDPIAWVTGNSYVPALRSFDAAEHVWRHADWGYGTFDAWELLTETLEDLLSKAGVALESPEYDNALYAIDLRRFEYRESDDGENLQDDWRAVRAPASGPGGETSYLLPEDNA